MTYRITMLANFHANPNLSRPGRTIKENRIEAGISNHMPS